jgi:hypothetical protein
MRNTARQTRENRTITVDFRSEATYFQLLGDGKAFLECVLAFVMALGFQLAHKPMFKGYWSTVMIFRLDLALRVTQTSSLRQKCLS